MRKSIKRNLAYDDQKDLYYVTMHYGMRPDGSRDRCVRTFHCLDDAESTLTEFLRLRALKRTRHGGEVILADWLEVWLRDFICPNREKTTVHGYENIIRLHLVPALGEVKLPELQPAQLQRYYAELLEKGLSHNTVRKHHVLLHTALEAAVRQGLLRENVTRYVTPPAKVLPSHRYYDPAQLRELFAAAQARRSSPPSSWRAIWGCGAARSADSNGAVWIWTRRSSPSARCEPPWAERSSRKSLSPIPPCGGCATMG